jgi:hypothetical protein
MKHPRQLARRIHERFDFIRCYLRFARDGWGLRYSWWMATLATDESWRDVDGNSTLPPPF